METPHSHCVVSLIIYPLLVLRKSLKRFSGSLAGHDWKFFDWDVKHQHKVPF